MFPISAAHAQAAGGAPGAGLIQFLPLVLIFVVFYFLLIRPQQQAQKKLKTTLASLKRGDRVITAGGIVGTVQKVREGESEIEVEIAPNVRVTVIRDTVTAVLGTGKPAASP